MLARYVLAILALLVTGVSAQADFKTVLAQRLGASPEFLVINMPPRPGAWPGAIFTGNMRMPLRHGDPNDPALVRGQPVSIESKDGIDLSASAGGGISGLFGIGAEAGTISGVLMGFEDAKVVDMTYGELISHIKAAPDAVEAAKRGQMPLIVIRAYEGIPMITLIKGSSASADAWAKVTKDIEARGTLAASSTNTVTYKATEQIVFAFETQQIMFDPVDLANDQLDVRLYNMPNELFEVRQAASDALIETLTGLEAASLNAPYTLWTEGDPGPGGMPIR